MKGELYIPKKVEVIGDGVFYNCDFSGELILPQTVKTIGEKAFAYNWRLMGVLEFPEKLRLSHKILMKSRLKWEEKLLDGSDSESVRFKY